MDEVETGLLIFLAVRQWVLAERQLVVVCPVIKMAAACQSVGCSSQTEDFQRSLRALIWCVDFLCL